MQMTVTDIMNATNGRATGTSVVGPLCSATIDSRTAGPQSLFVPLQGTRADGHDYIEDAFRRGAPAALAADGHAAVKLLGKRCPDKLLICVPDPLQALGDLAQSWRTRLPAPVVAITGSNGKTTTKEMAWTILSRSGPAYRNPGNFNNLIGLPLSLLQAETTDQAVLLELGMSAPGEIRRLADICRPTVGLITNIGPAHLEQLGTLDAVRDAKAELLERLSAGDTAILNHDDARLAGLAAGRTFRTVTFGLSGGDVQARALRDTPAGAAFDLHAAGAVMPVQLRLPGRHFVSNALAAAAIACTLGLTPEMIKAGLEAFTGVPGRMESRSVGPLTVINDAYNANPVSMAAALQALQSMPGNTKHIAVLGDMLELGADAARFHRDLGGTAARMGIDALLLIGDFASETGRGASEAGMSPHAITISPSMDELTRALISRAGRGDIVLLKGSRRMNMDAIVNSLRHHYGDTGA